MVCAIGVRVVILHQLQHAGKVLRLIAQSIADGIVGRKFWVQVEAFELANLTDVQAVAIGKGPRAEHKGSQRPSLQQLFGLTGRHKTGLEPGLSLQLRRGGVCGRLPRLLTPTVALLDADAL